MMWQYAVYTTHGLGDVQDWILVNDKDDAKTLAMIMQKHGYDVCVQFGHGDFDFDNWPYLHCAAEDIFWF